jgi:hypothetical protein
MRVERAEVISIDIDIEIVFKPEKMVYLLKMSF